MNIKEGLLKKTVLTIFFLLASTGIAHAQRSIVATLSAADSSTTGDCPTANACVVLVMTDSAGSAAFAIGANASGNTIQFEASADYKSNWVPFLVYPSNSTTGVTSTTSVGPATFSASAGSYTHVRMRISTFVSGTATTRINQSPASASSGRGSGGSAFPVTVTGGVSGGIPCFTSTTTEAASTLLAANQPVLGGGAGACPTTLATPVPPTGVSDFLTSDGTTSAWSVPGVAINAQTGTSYPIASSDRSKVITGSNGSATGWTIAQAGTGQFTNNFNFGGCNINTGLITITPTVSTWSGGTWIVPNHWCTFAYSDNTNYIGGTFPDLAAFPNSPTNALGFTSATGLFNSITALTATTVATGASPPTCTPGTAGVYCYGEGTAPTGAASVDDIYANSTNHCLTALNNNTDVGCLVAVGATNTAATAMTLDMSAATGATAFKVPVIAGATAGANGVIDYDSTNANTHIRTNGADSIAVAEAAALAVNAIPKATDATHGLQTASSLVDDAKNVTTSEVLVAGNKVFVTGDFTDSTTNTLQVITGLSWTLPTSKAVNVSFHCALLFDQATAAVSDSFGIGVTGTAPTQANASGTVWTNTSVGATGTLAALASTTPTAVVTFTPSAITTIWKAELDGTIEQPSNATPGVFNIYVSTSTGADNLIVKRGSYCSLF